MPSIGDQFSTIRSFFDELIERVSQTVRVSSPIAEVDGDVRLRAAPVVLGNPDDHLCKWLLR